VEKLRVRHLSWRTEQTYRGWAWRFAHFLGERPVESATGEEVRAFLSHLATAQRVGASARKQALNALVFLLREVEGKELGDFGEFTRARRRLRMPVVKWPKAGEAWEWQWFWPSRELMNDPRTGLRRRHHLLDVTFQHFIRQGAQRAKLNKKVTPHVLRQNAECREMPSEAGRTVKIVG
jgi:hypothetical protein